MRKTLIPFLFLFSAFCLADTVILKDGSEHQGDVQTVTASSVSIRENGQIRRYMRSNVQAIEFGDAAAYSDNAPALGARRDSDRNYNDTNGNYASNDRSRGRLGYDNNVTLPQGSEIVVMPNEDIDSANATVGQTFSADVAEDVTSNGQVIIPKGTEAELVLRNVQQQGAVTGNSEIALDLQSIQVNGRRYLVSTEDIQQQNNQGIGKNKRTATMVGGGAVLGTLIGAIAGGGKGAAIGAITGAGAGAGAQVLTRGKAVKVPAETKLRFKLDQPLDLRATN
jgi:outer membrane lipoprotein SlyB